MEWLQLCSNWVNHFNECLRHCAYTKPGQHTISYLEKRGIELEKGTSCMPSGSTISKNAGDASCKHRAHDQLPREERHDLECLYHTIQITHHSKCLRHYLQAQSQGHHTINCLDKRGMTWNVHVCHTIQITRLNTCPTA